MNGSRRKFMKRSAGLTSGALAMVAPFELMAKRKTSQGSEQILIDAIDEILERPLLKIDEITQPVIIESMQLLQNGEEFLVRVRSTDGVEGITATNSHWMADLYPIFKNRVAAFLVGKDARKIETLIEDLLQPDITYKLQGLALWLCVAAAEMSVLEMLGRITNKSIGQLFGGVQRDQIDVYRASGRRGNTPEEEVEHLKELLEETGGTAIKFRVGGQLSNNRDSLPGRSEALIPLVRKVFGDSMTIYADSNSSYDYAEAVRIGKLMEENNFAFFEEPCRFDNIWETKKVADTLDIPIAGGEQEFSMVRFRWAIENRGLDIVQPDLHYFGGFIRSTRVALMADTAGMTCTPHMSSWGLGMGYMEALHFMSYIPNPALHMEFKGYGSLPYECTSSSLKCENGQIKVPSGPGFGIDIDPDFIRASKLV